MAKGREPSHRFLKSNPQPLQQHNHLRVRISPALIEFDNEDGTYDVIYATGKRESGVARIRIIVSNMKETITGLMPESESESDESSYDDDDDDSSDSSESDDS